MGAPRNRESYDALNFCVLLQEVLILIQGKMIWTWYVS